MCVFFLSSLFSSRTLASVCVCSYALVFLSASPKTKSLMWALMQLKFYLKPYITYYISFTCWPLFVCYPFRGLRNYFFFSLFYARAVYSIFFVCHYIPQRYISLERATSHHDMNDTVIVIVYHERLNLLYS